jgi:hypothetical protein
VCCMTIRWGTCKRYTCLAVHLESVPKATARLSQCPSEPTPNVTPCPADASSRRHLPARAEPHPVGPGPRDEGPPRHRAPSQGGLRVADREVLTN